MPGIPDSLLIALQSSRWGACSTGMGAARLDGRASGRKPDGTRRICMSALDRLQPIRRPAGRLLGNLRIGSPLRHRQPLTSAHSAYSWRRPRLSPWGRSGARRAPAGRPTTPPSKASFWRPTTARGGRALIIRYITARNPVFGSRVALKTTEHGQPSTRVFGKKLMPPRSYQLPGA